MALHLNIEDLLSTRTVESDRIEYKEGWNPDAIYKSICAFANDFDNTGGGYILIGVEEDGNTKTAKRPIKGLSTVEIATIQTSMIGFNNLIQPTYHCKLFIEDVDDNQIIVLWVPGGSNRPYQVPDQITATTKRYFYFIRKYANSVRANLEEQQELIALANQIPFDDRANTQFAIDNISMMLVKEYLVTIKSKLANQIGKKPDIEILGQMELTSGPAEHIYPRNVSLMMFSDNPDRYFPATRVELVYFPFGEAGEFIEYPTITGPIPDQIKRTLDFLKANVLQEIVNKPSDQAESIRIWNYPLQAVEEILVNAFYHRDYQQREPIEIRMYPNSIVIINHGGPDRSIQLQAFDAGQVRSRRYRNRRLGEFLKELDLTEGKATGIPTILKALKDNGSPAPRFKTDDDRTYFEVELFVHPRFFKHPSIDVDISDIKHTFPSIDYVLNDIIRLATTIDGQGSGTIASAIAENVQDVDIQAIELLSRIDSPIVGTIANAIAGTLAERDIKLLNRATNPVKREGLLKSIGLKNLRQNYDDNVKHLEDMNWLTMTIPKKPTSPNQQYLTTLKGRLILEFLKRKT